MPNHTQTVVTFRCKDGKKTEFNEMCSYLLSSKESDGDIYPLDFELLIPSPKNMFNRSISASDEEQCILEGRPYWSKWCPENWGTKWNCYESKVVEHDENYILSIKFQTAWDFPLPIAKEIAKRYKDFAEIEFVTACEGGWFAGIYTVQADGKLSYVDLKENCWTLRKILENVQPKK